jgi:hypothetical protein
VRLQFYLIRSNSLTVSTILFDDGLLTAPLRLIALHAEFMVALACPTF